MRKVIHSKYLNDEKTLDDFVLNYNNRGEAFGNQDRNSLRLFSLNDEVLNAKSFRVPNLINKIAYRFFRKSKAERSYNYANRLMDLNIGTPHPVAFYEFKSALFFGKSYYISHQIDCDITYRELTFNFNYPDWENILRAFTRFTFQLHENQVNFLDHSPGNTLIIAHKDTYKFYLVDLNRMNFEPLSFEDRIKNFAKLTTHKTMVEIMSNEYAKCIGEDEAKVFKLMWKYTCDFQEKYHRRRRMKKKFKFWKK